MVTWEIAEERRQALIDALKAKGNYCPIHHNAWAVMAIETASELRDALGPLFDASDRLFIVRSGTEASWRHSYGKLNNEWLKTNL